MTAIDSVLFAAVSANNHPPLLRLRLLVIVAMKMMIMLMTMSAALGRGEQQQHPCPSSMCTCHGSELVDCRDHQLMSVPSFRPSNVTYDKVRLYDNRIRHIGASAFDGIRFRKLEIVKNPLSSVHAAAFSGLEFILNEVELQLDKTGAEFPHKALTTLSNLTTLKVAYFPGAMLPAGALARLPTLRELHLTSGSLEALTAADVTGQRTALEVLDISGNKLREFPTDAIRTLAGLKSLNVRANLIDHLGGGSVVSRSLAELDVSHHALDRAGINSTAFDGVATVLRRLVMSHCHLLDRHAPAVARASGLVELVVSFNHLTSVRTFVADLPRLERLDVQNNSVSILTTASLPSPRCLRALNLAYNPLKDVHPNAFVELRSLEDLKLDFARAAVPLSRASFASQRSTLRNLSLRGVDLSAPQWSVIDGLRRLEMVSLSGCRLGNIPPFTFRHSGGRLHTLELAGNRIDELNQRSLVGLESSLVRLNLDGNRLTTIDRCAFYGFTQLDPMKLFLRNNSLACDCRLRWLYDWTNASRAFLFWRCSDGRPFWRLADDDFQNCTDDTTLPCEDFTPPTTPSTEPRPLVSLFVVNVTSTSFAVRWTVDSAALSAADMAGVRINCSCEATWTTVDTVVREHRYEGLAGGTEYRVCVTLRLVDMGNWTEDDVTSCLDVTTTSWLKAPAVMSVVVVSGVLLVALLLAVVVSLVVRRWRRRRRMRLAELAQPKIAAGRTKRFMRQTQRPRSLEANDRVDALRFQSRSVETNLDRMQEDQDEDDRYRTLLALRLLQSRNARSLDNLVDGLNSAPSYFMNQLYGKAAEQEQEQEVYDEINEEEVD